MCDNVHLACMIICSPFSFKVMDEADRILNMDFESEVSHMA